MKIGGGWEQNSSWTEQNAQEADEDATEHSRHIERGGNPGRLVEAEAERAAKIGQANTDQARIQSGYARAKKDPNNPKPRVGGRFVRGLGLNRLGRGRGPSYRGCCPNIRAASGRHSSAP